MGWLLLALMIAGICVTLYHDLIDFIQHHNQRRVFKQMQEIERRARGVS